MALARKSGGIRTGDGPGLFRRTSPGQPSQVALQSGWCTLGAQATVKKIGFVEGAKPSFNA
jgi:hypothetical protein